MMLLLRIELYKMRTTRLPYGLAVAALGLSAALSLLEASRAARGLTVAPLSTAAGLQTVTTATSFALLLATLLGVTVTSGEFRHGTATLTYLSFPRRARVLAAKVLAAAGGGAVLGLAAGTVTTAVGLAFAAARGDGVALVAGTLLAHIGGAGLAAALLAAVGAGLGALVGRGTPGDDGRVQPVVTPVVACYPGGARGDLRPWETRLVGLRYPPPCRRQSEHRSSATVLLPGLARATPRRCSTADRGRRVGPTGGMSFCGVQEDLLFAAGRVNLSDGAQRVLIVLVADLRQYDETPTRSC